MENIDFNNKLIELKKYYDLLVKTGDSSRDIKEKFYQYMISVDDYFTSIEHELAEKNDTGLLFIRKQFKNQMLYRLYSKYRCLEMAAGGKSLLIDEPERIVLVPTNLENATTSILRPDGSRVSGIECTANRSNHFIGIGNCDSYHYIKFYFNMDPEQISSLLSDSIELIQNGYSFTIKSRFVIADDMVTIRVSDVENIDVIVQLINKYKKPFKNKPFLPIDKDLGVGVILDNGSSYHEYITGLLTDYLKHEDNIGLDSFIDYFNRSQNLCISVFDDAIHNIIEGNDQVLESVVEKYREKHIKKI